MKNFEERMVVFHSMYGLPQPTTPQPIPHDRLERFREILGDEMAEGADVLVLGDELETLTNMADWLCDIIVYCASEAKRHGIPLGECMNIILDSNESKLGEDGQAIIADGKVQKGPNYWKPEPKLRALLAARMRDAA